MATQRFYILQKVYEKFGCIFNASAENRAIRSNSSASILVEPEAGPTPCWAASGISASIPCVLAPDVIFRKACGLPGISALGRL
jgi:hypothetical protein